MIPKIIHFINIGSRPFTFIHFLAIYTAWKVNADATIYMHLTDEPLGKWWEKARPLCTLNQVERVESIFGNPVSNPAHMADVIRLNMLEQYGGIYLDLDVVCINSFTPLLDKTFVMGQEPDSGLCNAVILSDKSASFLHQWKDNYRTFDTKKWNYHSVILPWKMSRAHPEQITILDKYSFFYPQPHDPAHLYLWGKKPSIFQAISRLGKNALAYFYYRWFKKSDSLLLNRYGTFHLLHGVDWHFRKASQAYCIHLWEGFWREPYLDKVDPDYLISSDSNFAKLMRNVIGVDEIKTFDS